MKEFARKLASFLKDKKEYYADHTIQYDGYCSTCYSESTIVTIDEEELWKQIDEFCATFNKEPE